MCKAVAGLLVVGALCVVGGSSTSCSGGGAGGAGGGSATAGGGSATAGGSAGGMATETADADAGTCTPAMVACTFVDGTAADAGRTIEFGTTNPGASVPECLRVKVGQTVRFVTGANHPVVQTCGPKNRKLAAPDSATTNITFGLQGDYAGVCGIHQFPTAIRVEP